MANQDTASAQWRALFREARTDRRPVRGNVAGRTVNVARLRDGIGFGLARPTHSLGARASILAVAAKARRAGDYASASRQVGYARACPVRRIPA